MSIRALVAQARALRTIHGRPCVRVGVGALTTLLLDFGKLFPPDPTGYEEPEFSVVAECPWRLETRERVIVGSGDERETIRAKGQVLLGRHLIESSIALPSYSARIDFEGEVILWIFPDAAEDYVDEDMDPRAPWYLAGRALPSDWNE